jgi:RNA polymerase sigma-B factor
MAAISPGRASVAESVPDSVAPPDRMLKKELGGLDDQALLGLVRLSPQASERRAAACELLVTRHQGLVRSCVRPYLRSPEPAEDLMQVGYIGLLKAISNFDPAAGCSLATYARPCISGELKRHFRDKRWQIRVKRPVQELVLEVREATWRLAQELGRTPTETDIARHLGVSGDDLRQARRAELAFWPNSLDAPLPGQPSMIILADVLGEEDPRMEHMLGMQAVATHWGELPAREQEILRMDFRGGMTQAQIGQRLRMSQMQVSRLRSHALGYLRSRLLDLEGTSAAKGPCAVATGANRLCRRPARYRRRFRNPDETDDLLRLGLHRLPIGQFPLLRSLAPVLAAYDGAAELERGLDILLTGLATTLPPPDGARSSS